MFCPSCGNEAEGAKFCPECGLDLTALRAAAQRVESGVCGACGTDVGEARFCPECGQAAGAGRPSQRRVGRPAARPSAAGPRPRTTGRATGRVSAAAREPEAAYHGRGRGSKLKAIIGIAALAMVAVVTLVVVLGPADEPAVAIETVAVGGKVKIPVQDLAGGDARFYTYDAGGVPVKFFVLRSSDGEYRAALDASEECGPFKQGFRQEGTDMVCNKCAQKYAFTSINVLSGACNPLSLERKVSGQDLVLNTADLEKGVQYFQ